MLEKIYQLHILQNGGGLQVTGEDQLKKLPLKSIEELEHFEKLIMNNEVVSQLVIFLNHLSILIIYYGKFKKMFMIFKFFVECSKVQYECNCSILIFDKFPENLNL